MYCVYQNQGQGPLTLGVTSLDRFYNLLLMKNNEFKILEHYGHLCSDSTAGWGGWVGLQLQLDPLTARGYSKKIQLSSLAV